MDAESGRPTHNARRRMSMEPTKQVIADELEHQDKLLNDPTYNWGFDDAVTLSAMIKDAVAARALP